MADSASTAPVGSPLWWLNRLSRALFYQQTTVRELEAYYIGDHPLPVVGNSNTMREAEAAYRWLLKAGVTNWCSLIADAPSDRLEVTGFQFSTPTSGGNPGWQIWQRNHLDADQQLFYDGALQARSAYAIVWADADGDAEITIEHPSQCIVAYEAGSRRCRAAALKQWLDESGELMATVYLPDGIHKFRTTGATDAYAYQPGIDGPGLPWVPREVPNEAWPVDNPLGVVPVVELRANASLRPAPFGGGRAEFEQVLPSQDRINRTLFNRLVTQEFQSFRQRWATGIELKVDDKGQPINPFPVGANTLWGADDVDVKFGEFSESDLSGFLAAVEADVRHMAAITRTPPYYLLGDMVNISGDALTASEAGLTNKVRRHQRAFGESLEEVMRLALTIEGNPLADDEQSMVLWADPEQRTTQATVDSLTKLGALGVPQEELWRMIPGVNQQTVERWKLIRDKETWFGKQGFGVPGTLPTTAVPAPPPSDAPPPGDPGMGVMPSTMPPAGHQ